MHPWSLQTSSSLINIIITSNFWYQPFLDVCMEHVFYTVSLSIISRYFQANDNEDFIHLINFHRCHSNYYNEWVAGLLCYQGLLLLFGMFLAWETRHVEHPALNDSKSIALAVYNVFMFSALTVLTEFLLTDIPTKVLLSRISVYGCSTSTICFLFVPKVTEVSCSRCINVLSLRFCVLFFIAP